MFAALAMGNNEFLLLPPVLMSTCAHEIQPDVLEQFEAPLQSVAAERYPGLHIGSVRND